MFSSLWAPVKTPKEMLKENQASIRQGIREIDRAQRELMKKEELRQKEIKIMASKGQMPTVRVMAKDLARMRTAIAKFYSVKAELESVSFNLATMQSTVVMADAMKGAARAMMRMNVTQNLPALQKVMMTFVKEQDMLNMKQEVMNDTMETAMQTDEQEEEEIVGRVLDELGIQMAEALGSVPVHTAEAALPPDLASRLENLKK